MGILDGEVELCPPSHTLLHGADHGLRRVTERRHRDPETEVDVLTSVDVRERSAVTVIHEERRMVVEECHPRERHAQRHRPPGPLAERERARVLGGEPRVLAGLEPVDMSQVDDHGSERCASLTAWEPNHPRDELDAMTRRGLNEPTTR